MIYAFKDPFYSLLFTFSLFLAQSSSEMIGGGITLEKNGSQKNNNRGERETVVCVRERDTRGSSVG